MRGGKGIPKPIANRYIEGLSQPKSTANGSGPAQGGGHPAQVRWPRAARRFSAELAVPYRERALLGCIPEGIDDLCAGKNVS
jgi:hypothetical protein